MTEANLKNVQGERSDQENEEDGSHGSKIKQRVIQRDSSLKGANLSRKERQGNDVAHPLLPNLVLHLDEDRRKVRSKVKRSEGKDLLVRLRLHLLLISQALRVTGKTKKPRGSILYWMKINLNGTSRLSLHLMQTHSLRNTSQRKAFTTQSVKCILYQTT